MPTAPARPPVDGARWTGGRRGYGRAVVDEWTVGCGRHAEAQTTPSWTLPKGPAKPPGVGGDWPTLFAFDNSSLDSGAPRDWWWPGLWGRGFSGWGTSPVTSL